MCGEEAIIISIVPAGDDVRDSQRPDGDEHDAGHDLDDAAEADGEQGEEGGDEEPPARAVNHDALTNSGIALSQLDCSDGLTDTALITSLLPPLKHSLQDT